MMRTLGKQYLHSSLEWRWRNDVRVRAFFYRHINCRLLHPQTLCRFHIMEAPHRQFNKFISIYVLLSHHTADKFILIFMARGTSLHDTNRNFGGISFSIICHCSLWTSTSLLAPPIASNPINCLSFRKNSEVFVGHTRPTTTVDVDFTSLWNGLGFMFERKTFIQSNGLMLRVSESSVLFRIPRSRKWSTCSHYRRHFERNLRQNFRVSFIERK